MFRFLKLLKRLEEIEEKLERLERSVKNIEVEWTDTYDKFRQLHWRVAKRVKQLEANSSQEEPQGVGGDDNASAEFSSLSPRMRTIQAQILARRKQQGGE
jgi:hypothetical protein